MANNINKKKKKNNIQRKQSKQQKGLMPRKNLNPFIIVSILISLILFNFLFSEQSKIANYKETDLSTIFQELRNNNAKEVLIQDSQVLITLNNEEQIRAKKEPGTDFYSLLETNNIDPNQINTNIKYEPIINWWEVFINLIPLIFMIFIFWMIFRSVKGGGGMFSIGKSKDKLFNSKDKNKINFKDVAGNENIKQELYEIVDFLKNPQKYQKVGARIPRGILLVGPAGVGKTLLARAVAGEANVPFFSVAGSEFVEMIVGVGSSRVRDLFAKAKAASPALIFIDEIDAIGRHRGRSSLGGNDEREQTLNQILVEMDGFDQRTNVIVIAATNRADMLDKALVRPGRFDRHITIDIPDVKERTEIVSIHMNNKKFADNVDASKIAQKTMGFSGADIENVLNEAAILSAREDTKAITLKNIDDAATRVKLGPARNLLHTEEERKVVAYHESGHALVSAYMPKSKPVNKISIVSRTRSLGHTEYVNEPNSNNYNVTKNEIVSKIATILGGRAAEEIVFNDISIGASGDIHMATDLAKKMVVEWGMSKLGMIKYAKDDMLFNDGTADNDFSYSDETAREIDEEVRSIISELYKKALDIINEHRELLDQLSNILLEKENIEKEEFQEILDNYKNNGNTISVNPEE